MFPQCRPIISSSGSLTEQLSWYVDQNCKTWVSRLPSYIEDSTDQIRHLEGINENKSLPINAIPISLDIKSMYNNIPSDEGIEAMRVTLENREDKSVHTYFLVELIKIVLECNAFEFDKQYFLQQIGTVSWDVMVVAANVAK